MPTGREQKESAWKFYDERRELRMTVQPESGMALVFVHQQLHEGASVLNGRKYVLRTDVMYVPPKETGDT